MTPPDDAPTGDADDGESADEGLLTRRDTLAIGGTALGAAALATGGTIVGAQDDGSGGGNDGAGDAGNTFRVTVTNLTTGQPFTPPAVALHASSVDVFSVGEPANEAVQALAENGNLGPLTTLIDDTSAIYAAAVGDAPLVPREDPGDTGNPFYASFEIQAEPAATHLTFLSMLIATNDGFVGLDTVELPQDVNESKTLHADGYDAGTEENTEAWDDLVPSAQELISGNTASGGTTESSSELAEDDVIHPHPGISGDGDLDAETYDWDEPAGVVHVEKIAEAGETPDDDGDADEDGTDDGDQTDTDGDATDDDGNVTDDDGNVTDDNGNVTDDTDGNVTDDGGNVTDDGNVTDGENVTDGTNGNQTDGGNVTDGNGGNGMNGSDENGANGDGMNGTGGGGTNGNGGNGPNGTNGTNGTMGGD